MSDRPLVRVDRSYKRPTYRQKTRFLELLQQGVRPDLAGIEVGSRSSRFKVFLREDHPAYDEKFASAYIDAIEARRARIANEARDELERRQLGDDPKLKSDKGLADLLVLYDDEFRDRVRPAAGATVNVSSEVEVTNVHVELAGAADSLRAKLAPVVERLAAGELEAGDLSRTG